MDKLIEAIIRECGMRMGIMIGDAELPPGLAANLELRIRQWQWETSGGARRDYIQLMDDFSTSIGQLKRESIEGNNKCHSWEPQARS